MDRREREEEVTEKKPDRRSGSMKARMADPVFRQKALDNLSKGRAARAAAKRKPDSKPGSINPGSNDAKPDGGGSTKPSAKPAAPPAAGTRSFGVGRWRGQ